MNWIKLNTEDKSTYPESCKKVLLCLSGYMGKQYSRLGFYTIGNDYIYNPDHCEIDNCKYCDDDNNDHWLDEGFYQEIDDHATCDGSLDRLSDITHWAEYRLPDDAKACEG